MAWAVAAAQPAAGKIFIFFSKLYGALHDNNSMSDKQVKLIKRYKNRRLYDTELKQTIKLEDIRRYMDSGIEVKVIDNTTGEDITVHTLVTVLSSTTSDSESLEKNKSILQKLIDERGAGVMDAMKKLMLAGIGAINMSREKAEEMFDELVKRGEITKDEKSEAMKKMADQFEERTGKIRTTVENKIAETMERINIGGRLDELTRKVDELSSRVDELSQKLSEKESGH